MKKKWNCQSAEENDNKIEAFNLEEKQRQTWMNLEMNDWMKEPDVVWTHILSKWNNEEAGEV